MSTVSNNLAEEYLTTQKRNNDNLDDVCKTIEEISKTKDITKLADELGLSQEEIKKALSLMKTEECTTMLKIFKALGVSLSIK